MKNIVIIGRASVRYPRISLSKIAARTLGAGAVSVAYFASLAVLAIGVYGFLV